jgi:hypothetical protein
MLKSTAYMHVIVADAVWEFLSVGKVVKFFDLLMSIFFSGARPAVPMGVNDEADPLKFLSGDASLVVERFHPSVVKVGVKTAINALSPS